MKKYLASLMCFCLLFSAGCQNKTEEDKLTLLLDWFPNPNHAMIFSALEQGFFKDEGLNIELINLKNPSDALPLLSTGKVDLAVSYPSTTLSAKARGANLFIAGILIREPLNCFLFHEDQTLNSPQDLEGKVVGYSSNGFGCPVLNFIFAKHHIEPAATHNVNFDLISTLGNRQVDVAIGGYFNIETEQFAQMGVPISYRKITDFGVPNYPALVCIGNTENTRLTPETIAKFKTALAKAATFCKQAPHQAFEDYKKLNSEKTEENLKWEEKSWEKTFPLLADNQTPNMDEWNTYISWLKEIEVLKEPVDPKTLFLEVN